jgi:hypothetical protein
MPGGNEFNDAALWRRWREGDASPGEAAAEPDALILAAYAENRLGRPGIDPENDPAIAAVEAWFVDCPEALDDVVAARSPNAGPAREALVARAQSLIAQPDEKVWPLPLVSARPSWRSAATWSGIAASMVVAVLIGFQLSRYNIMDLPDSGQNPTVEQAAIGTPGTILATDDEDSGI